jgi:O-6-methylguanine DNA methyltransferase
MSTRPGETQVCWPARGRRSGALAWRAFHTPWGDGLVAADADGLRLVELPRVGQEATAPAPQEMTPEQRTALETWAPALEEYFRGERLNWSSEDIPWDELGVRPFERAVYEALLTVSPGETVSYGRLAEMAGHPRAARAVGSAMAANPIPVLIPCHRVIRADGGLGNYGDDPSWKPRLLEHERSAVSRRAI